MEITSKTAQGFAFLTIFPGAATKNIYKNFVCDEENGSILNAVWAVPLHVVTTAVAAPFLAVAFLVNMIAAGILQLIGLVAKHCSSEQFSGWNTLDDAKDTCAAGLGAVLWIGQLVAGIVYPKLAPDWMPDMVVEWATAQEKAWFAEA